MSTNLRKSDNLVFILLRDGNIAKLHHAIATETVGERSVDVLQWYHYILVAGDSERIIDIRDYADEKYWAVMNLNFQDDCLIRAANYIQKAVAGVEAIT